MAKRGRPRNPRRVVLDMIRELKHITSSAHDRWNWVPGEDCYRNAEGSIGFWGHRDRKDIPASEYRENDPAYWAELHGQMAQLQVQALKIAKFAREQYIKTGGGANG